MLEIEAKMKLDRPEPAVAALEAHGARELGDYLELNTFFDTEDRALLSGDRGLRLRVSTDLRTNASKCVLTHKGPDRHGPLKAREETELTVENADDAAHLLARLGFVPMLSFEKKRHSWHLADCRIELDEVPLLGHYIEIEGPSDASVMRVRQTLGLAHLPLIKTSYIAMLISHLQEHGHRTTTQILFPRP